MSFSRHEILKNKPKNFILSVFVFCSFYNMDNSSFAQSESLSTKSNLKNSVSAPSIKKKSKPSKRQKKNSESLSKILGPTGSLRLGYWSQNRQFSSQNNFLASSAWLNLNSQGPGEIKFVYDGYLRNDDTLRNGPLTGDLREAYADKSLGAFDFRLGRQIIVWGRADKINPTDNLGVRDLNLLTVEDDDQRTGLFSLKSVLHIEDYSIIGVWLPEWRYTRFSIPPINGISVSETAPERSQEQWALKLDHTGGNIDGSISFFNGIDKTPDLSVGSQTATSTQIFFLHKRINVWGADFAKNIGSFALRGEFAYEQTENPQGQDLLTKNPFFLGVVGGDINFTENFNLNVQYILKKIDHFQAIPSLPPSVAFLVQEERLITQQLYETQQGISFRHAVKFLNDTITFDVSALYWFSQGDYILSPKFIDSFSDQCKFSVGGNIYGGPAISYLGAQQPISAFYAELKLLF